MMKPLLLSTLAFTTLLPISAAHRQTQRPTAATVMADSITAKATEYHKTLDQLTLNLSSAHPIENGALLSDPYYFPIFAAPALYDAPLRTGMSLYAEIDSTTLPHLVAETLLDTYARHPELISLDLTSTNLSVPGVETPEVAPAATISEAASRNPALHSTITFQVPEEVQLDVRKPNFWKFIGNFSFQFMQYYVSDNWYKGGENHNSFLVTMNLEANYDNKEKLTFANKLEMRLGFQSSNSDTQHRYKTNSDLLRMTSKLGLQAAHNWYYTMMLQSWTQFYRGYKSNDPTVYSDFMSPFESVFSIGMDYKLNKKKFELTANISPLAVNFKYVDRLPLSVRYGLDEGKHAHFDFGSSATINTKWNIVDGVQWTSRFFAFTSYSRVQAEWEHTFNFKVNKFLSAKLFFYPRFDDGLQRKSGDTYFQFNEFLSIGFDYNF